MFRNHCVVRKNFQLIHVRKCKYHSSICRVRCDIASAKRLSCVTLVWISIKFPLKVYIYVSEMRMSDLGFFFFSHNFCSVFFFFLLLSNVNIQRCIEWTESVIREYGVNDDLYGLNETEQKCRKRHTDYWTEKQKMSKATHKTFATKYSFWSLDRESVCVLVVVYTLCRCWIWLQVWTNLI